MTFDLDFTKDEKNEFGLLEPGIYNAVIDEVKIANAKTDNSEYIMARFKIVDEKYKGRVVFKNFMIAHTNPKVAQIARGQISTLLKINDKPRKIESVNDLCGLSCSVKIVISKRDGYEDKNEINGIYKLKNIPNNDNLPF